MRKDLKTIMKEAMEVRGIKTPELAVKLGIPKYRIYAWYRDDTNPKESDSYHIKKWIKDPSYTAKNEETFNSLTVIPPIEKARPNGRAPGIEERMEEIESSLGTVRKNQDGLLNFVTELLYRDCLKEAKGNEEKAREILDEILHRISPELSSRLKRGIHDGDGNGGMA